MHQKPQQSNNEELTCNLSFAEKNMEMCSESIIGDFGCRASDAYIGWLIVIEVDVLNPNFNPSKIDYKWLVLYIVSSSSLWIR